MVGRKIPSFFKELNAQKTVVGRPIIVSIEKGLYDFMLTAKLGGEEKCLEVYTVQAIGQQK